ncbi:MAG: hypothetical protein KIT83_04720 [Bryobacterales bacterium]|nr:hypothetical protein [Bryobacterales bacterium]
MTRDLRNLHWGVFRALRWVVPVMLLVAFSGYRWPVSGELPASLRQELPESAILSSEIEEVFDGRRIRVQLYTEPAGGDAFRARRWVRITLQEPLRQPDVIVYWSTRASAYDRPPLGSQMLGVLDERQPAAFPLPSQAAFLAGRLVFYSLGQHVLIAQVPLPSSI